jgi:hypothetical protein
MKCNHKNAISNTSELQKTKPVFYVKEAVWNDQIFVSFPEFLLGFFISPNYFETGKRIMSAVNTITFIQRRHP